MYMTFILRQFWDYWTVISINYYLAQNIILIPPPFSPTARGTDAAVFLRAQQAGCVGAGIAVGVYKSAGCRVVVTALEVVERQGQRSDLTSTPPEPRLKGSQFYGEIHGLKKDEDGNGLGGAVIGLAAGNVNGVKIVHLADFLLNRDY